MRLDPSFARLWDDHLGRLLSRTKLDLRTRFLVLTSQYTITERHEQLREHVGAARDNGVDAAELLEAILQTYVYAGPWVVAAAGEVFEGVLTARSESIGDSALRAHDPGSRSIDAERRTWTERDRNDPRLETLLDTYGWRGISNGLRLRPGHHLDMVATLDALDPDFLSAWLDAVYEGMYGRGVLDDRTRLLCVVGATMALGETHQSRRHMRAAMRCGATAVEVLEVVFLTTAFFGHPHVMPAAFDDLILILDDEDRLDELLPADRRDDVCRIVAARAARRSGVVDDPRSGAP